MMPMPSYMGPCVAGPSPAGQHADAFLDDISRQISLAQQTRRYSRGSGVHGQACHGHSLSQHAGSMMRVVKPATSASNSPRSALMQARRRTMVNDGLLARRSQQILEQAFIPGPAVETSFADPAKRATRPVSWHPSTQMGQLQQQQQQQQQFYTYQQTPPMAPYPFPTYSEADFYTQYQPQFSPTAAAYSGYSSPTAFSPLSLPYSTFEAPQYTIGDDWMAGPIPSSKMAVSPPSDCPELLDQSSSCTQVSAGTLSDTSSQLTSSTENDSRKEAIAPPTPDNYPVAPPPEPLISSEESIPFEPLEDEEEGEILIGMGLYDPPEKPIGDSTLDSYRASVAHLLGTSYNYPEPTGKGLKLEDSWEPPAKSEDDEEEEEENEENEGEEDADGEDQE